MTSSSSSDPSSVRTTHFASPERAEKRELQESVLRVSNSELLSFTLGLLDGWVAVLNEHRQVLAVNHAFLLALGVDEPDRVLGLRPGEALHCAHAQDHPAGCGTSRFCRTCGAVIAMVAAQESGLPQERECILTSAQNGAVSDRTFVVRAGPIPLNGSNFLLIAMKDVSEEKRRMMLERSFLHDLSNLVLGLDGGFQLLKDGNTGLLDQICRTMGMLRREVRVQQALVRSGSETPLETEGIRPSQVLCELETIMGPHGAAHKEQIHFQRFGEDEPWQTDPGLLLRVLMNMVMNALEAGQAGDQVYVRAETTSADVNFQVSNRQVIPEEVAWRMFQLSFSTKTGSGRGVGTFAMKLLGEKLLKGTVAFTSTPAHGTTFCIRLPRRYPTQS